MTRSRKRCEIDAHRRGATFPRRVVVAQGEGSGGSQPPRELERSSQFHAQTRSSSRPTRARPVFQAGGTLCDILSKVLLTSHLPDLRNSVSLFFVAKCDTKTVASHHTDLFAFVCLKVVADGERGFLPFAFRPRATSARMRAVVVPSARAHSARARSRRDGTRRARCRRRARATRVRARGRSRRTRATSTRP